MSNPDASARNQRLYDSIESKTNRRAVPRMLYKMLFVKPVLDTTMSGRVTDESRLLQPYSGKTIGEITIDRRQVFDPNAPPTRPTASPANVSSAATCFSNRATRSIRN